MSYTRQLRLDEATLFAIQNTRAQDHETSIAAAEKTFKTAPRHRLIALRAHYEHRQGLTDFELADRTGIQQTSIGKRRLDLVRLELLEGTTERRPSPTGSPTIVWKITAKGIQEIEKETRE